MNANCWQKSQPRGNIASIMSVSFAQLHQAQPSSQSRRMWWHLLSAGTVWRDEVERHEGADKAGLHLFWVRSGKGHLITPQGRVALARGAQCWLVDLRATRSYEPDAGCRLVTEGFRFAGSSLDAWLETLGGPGLITLGEVPWQQLRKMQRSLLKLAAQHSRPHEWTAHELLTQAWGILFAARGSLARKASTFPDPVRRVLAAVSAAPSRDWRATDLAEIARQSYSGLRESFKATRGETLHDYIQKVRLTQASALLADERLSIKEVSAKLQFRCETYFTHWFRRHTSQSPGVWRKSARG
jgi:AraC-like DNA-binding protein